MLPIGNWNSPLLMFRKISTAAAILGQTQHNRPYPPNHAATISPVLLVRIERGEADQHLEDQDAKLPHVHHPRVAGANQHLWGLCWGRVRKCLYGGLRTGNREAGCSKQVPCTGRGGSKMCVTNSCENSRHIRGHRQRET